MTHFVVAFSQPPFAQYGSTISHMNEKKTEIGLVTLPQLQLLCQIRWKLPRLAFCQIFCIFVVSNSQWSETYHGHVIYHSKAKITLVGLSTLNRNNDVRVVRYPAITVFCSKLPRVCLLYCHKNFCSYQNHFYTKRFSIKNCTGLQIFITVVNSMTELFRKHHFPRAPP